MVSLLADVFPNTIFSLSHHLSSLIRWCFYHLRQLRLIHQSLPFMPSWLWPMLWSAPLLCDYGNAVYIGLSSTSEYMHQAVVNAFANLIAKFTHIFFFTLYTGWVPICRFVAFCPKGRGLESHSSRHVGTLGKSFTRNCLRRFGVKLRHSIWAVSGAPLSSSGLEEVL